MQGLLWGGCCCGVGWVRCRDWCGAGVPMGWVLLWRGVGALQVLQWGGHCRVGASMGWVLLWGGCIAGTAVGWVS